MGRTKRGKRAGTLMLKTGLVLVVAGAIVTLFDLGHSMSGFERSIGARVATQTADRYVEAFWASQWTLGLTIAGGALLLMGMGHALRRA